MISKTDNGETITRLLRLGVNAQKNGNYTEAELHYRHVLEVAPDNVNALHYLGLIALDLEHFGVASELLEKAISLSPHDPLVCYNLGLSYHRQGFTELAIKTYKRAIELNPDLSIAYNNLGVALQDLGDHELAADYLERSISIQPNQADAYYNLARCKKYDTIPAWTRDMLELLKKPDLPPNDQSRLHFGLGKIYDDAGQYENAFEQYRLGNELKQAPFNLNAYQHYISHIKAVFTADFLGARQPQTYQSRQLIFIVGMPRSGTTLIEQILGRHSNVTAGGEIGFIGELIDNFNDILGTDEDYPVCVHQLRTEDITLLAQRILVDLATLHPGFHVLTDKTPVNFLHLGLIALLFPNCKIIHCQRDPLDTCLSCYFQNFSKQHHYTNDLETLGLFYRLYEDLMFYWKAVLPLPIHTVRYEHLVHFQKETTRDMLEFCGLDWEERCLDFNEQKNTVSTASNWQVRQPLYSSSIGRWKNYETYIGELKKILEPPATDS